MTIPSDILIDGITDRLSPDDAIKNFQFKTIKSIDGLDVTVRIYLHNNRPKDKSSSNFRIESDIRSVILYRSETFKGDDHRIAIKKSLEEIYRILPNLKADKLYGEISIFLDEGLGTKYINTESCCVCLEPTFTKLYCRHFLCISCQNSMHKINRYFTCPVCRRPHYENSFRGVQLPENVHRIEDDSIDSQGNILLRDNEGIDLDDVTDIVPDNVEALADDVTDSRDSSVSSNHNEDNVDIVNNDNYDNDSVSMLATIN